MNDLALLICTRNRAVQLRRTLESVGRIEARSLYQIVVADNGSTDATKEVVQAFRAWSKRPVQFLEAKGRGVSYARNAAWQAAEAPIVTYLDDDCYPAPDYPDAVLASFAGRPQIGYVGGRILLHDPTDRRITIQESLTPQEFEVGSFVRPGMIQGANVAFRREALTAVQGFDLWFGAGAYFTGEEAELLARMSAAGWIGRYDPRPVVYHHHGRKTYADEWRLMRSYDWGRGAYYAKCLMNHSMRRNYWRNWRQTRKHHSWKTSVLEAAGGTKYFLQAVLAGRVFGPRAHHVLTPSSSGS